MQNTMDYLFLDYLATATVVYTHGDVLEIA